MAANVAMTQMIAAAEIATANNNLFIFLINIFKFLINNLKKMSHLIICLGKDSQEKVHSMIRHFDNIYVISEGIENIDVKSLRVDQKISLLLMPNLNVRELSDALFSELKSQLSKDKIVDLDIAVNIASGSGKIHAATISSIIKLGYGIRLVDSDIDGKLIEL